MIWALTAAGAVLGILLGWLLRGDRPAGDRPQDWMTRLASRDEDLRAAQEDLADTVLELQELQAAADRRSPDPDGALQELTEARKAILELGRDLESARQTLTRLGEPMEDLPIEELEAGPAALGDRRCPDPDAHRTADDPAPTGAADAEASPGRHGAGHPATTRRPSVDG